MLNQQQLLFDQQDVQKMAADPRFSVYLAASAGTGKTKVLCDRFLRLLLAGSKPASIFCVTFTKAAASEMLKRIVEKLEHWQNADDIVVMQELRLLAVTADQQMCKKAKMLYGSFIAAFDHLKIFTLHAFCQSVLTKYSENNSALKSFEIIDALKARELKKDAFEQAINQDNLHDDVLFLTEFLELRSVFEDVSFLLNSPNKLMAIPLDYVSQLECQYDVAAFFQSNSPGLEKLLQMLQAAGSKKASVFQRALLNRDLDGIHAAIFVEKGRVNSRLFTKKFLEQNHPNQQYNSLRQYRKND
jgi:ATP-dependent exoDNAse (exonuclease V) beta subunit